MVVLFYKMQGLRVTLTVCAARVEHSGSFRQLDRGQLVVSGGFDEEVLALQPLDLLLVMREKVDSFGPTEFVFYLGFRGRTVRRGRSNRSLHFWSMRYSDTVEIVDILWSNLSVCLSVCLCVCARHGA
jgi:hypothetical protein